MPAELQFIQSSQGQYDTLILHQDGKQTKAPRIASQRFELYDTILHLDSALYNAYNARDLKRFMSFFSPDLVFYHDLNGKTNYKENLERFKINFAKPTKMRRTLLAGSLQVYPIKNFGAIQMGAHVFYQTDGVAPERMVGQPQFMHIWKKTVHGWKIVKIVSYDH